MSVIVVHAPMNPAVLRDKAVAKRRKPYEGLCGEYSKLPPTAKVKECEPLPPNEGGPYLVLGPHERYFGWCRRCALIDDTLKPVAPL